MLDIKTILMTVELFGGIFCLICAAYILVGQKTEMERCKLLIIFLLLGTVQLFSDVEAYHFRGDESTLGYFAVRISNYLVFVINYLFGHISVRYMEVLMQGTGVPLQKGLKRWIEWISIGGVALITISQFTGWFYSFDEHNRYYRNDLFWMISALAGVMIVLLMILILKNCKYIATIAYIPLLLATMLPLAADIFQFFIYGFSLANISLMLAWIIMFLCYEVERSRKLVRQELLLQENKSKIEQQKQQLQAERTQIMLSQIRPHFLYNTLGTIEYLCGKDADKAKEAVHQFSKYLRMNMKTLTQMQPVSFDYEMEYVNSYLWIEKMRFGDELILEYDLKETDFCLPALTLQPIVENAVSHGIRGVDRTGTVLIASRREGNEAVITVADNGAGFDVKKIYDDDKPHIGLKNVRTRLKLMCAGTLELDSKPGEGTIVTIRIPIVKQVADH